MNRFNRTSLCHARGVSDSKQAANPSSRRKAFTLVELLVVVGVIALLISMLLPALNKAREAAKRVKCASNIRQLVQMSLMYAGENKGVMMSVGASSGMWFGNYGSVNDGSMQAFFNRYLKVPDTYPAAANWMDAVNKNTRFNTPRVLICPSSPAQADYFRISYSYYPGSAFSGTVSTRNYAMKVTKFTQIRKALRAGGGGVPANTPVPGNYLAMWTDRCSLSSAGNSGGPREAGHFQAGHKFAGGFVGRSDGSVLWYPFSADVNATESMVYNNAVWSPAYTMCVPSDAILTPADGNGSLKANGGVIMVGASRSIDARGIYGL